MNSWKDGNKAGLRQIDILIFGGAGKRKGIANAVASAKLINASKPLGVSIKTMGAFGDSQLAKDVEAGIDVTPLFTTWYPVQDK